MKDNSRSFTYYLSFAAITLLSGLMIYSGIKNLMLSIKLPFGSGEIFSTSLLLAFGCTIIPTSWLIHRASLTDPRDSVLILMPSIAVSLLIAIAIGASLADIVLHKWTTGSYVFPIMATIASFVAWRVTTIAIKKGSLS